MAKRPWTAAELKEFDKLTLDLTSTDQLVRINARIVAIPAFVKKHGEEKCNAMFAHLTKAK